MRDAVEPQFGATTCSRHAGPLAGVGRHRVPDTCFRVVRATDPAPRGPLQPSATRCSCPLFGGPPAAHRPSTKLAIASARSDAWRAAPTLRSSLQLPSVWGTPGCASPFNQTGNSERQIRRLACRANPPLLDAAALCLGDPRLRIALQPNWQKCPILRTFHRVWSTKGAKMSGFPDIFLVLVGSSRQTRVALPWCVWRVLVGTAYIGTFSADVSRKARLPDRGRAVLRQAATHVFGTTKNNGCDSGGS